MFKKGNTEASKKGKNKKPKELVDSIMTAFNSFVSENGEAGGVAYLQLMMMTNPQAFMTLLGKIIPKDVNASLKHDGELTVRWKS